MFAHFWRPRIQRARRTLQRTGNKGRAALARFHPHLQALEDRRLLAVLPPVGLVSWYRAEGNANDFADGNNGIPENGVAFVAGQVQQAFSLDGVDDRVRVPHSPSLSLTSFTVDAWFRIDTNPDTTKFIVSKGVTGDNAEVPGNNFNYRIEVFGADSGTGALKVNCGFEQTDGTNHFLVGQTTIPIGQFVHAAVTYDGSTVKLYVNGVLDGQLATTAAPELNAQDVVIGGAVVGPNSLNNHFPGLIDEVDIYGHALSAPEIQGIFNAGTEGKATVNVDTVVDTVAADSFTSLREAINFSETVPARDVIGFSVPRPFTNGLVSWYRGEGNANDIVDANPGTLQNGATATGVGRYGQAFSFNGVDDYVGQVLPANIKNQNITIDAWVRINSLTGIGQTIVFAEPRDSGSVSSGAGMDISSTGQVRFLKGRPGINMYDIVAGTTVLSTGVWHHVAGTYDGATMRVYLNGVLEGSLAEANGIDWNDGAVGFPDPGQLYFGAFKDSSLGAGPTTPNLRFLNGSIDEIGIFNRALSAAEVQAIATGPRTISPTMALPTLTQSVIIDGYTQPGAVQNTDPTGFNGNLLIEINGAGQGFSGLDITAGNSTVRGLVVNNFQGGGSAGIGIDLRTNGGNRIEGNFLGTDPSGTLARPTTNAAIIMETGSNANIVGGTAPAARNVISGNSIGLGIFTSGNVIQGNFIGTKRDGLSPLGNNGGVFFIGIGSHNNNTVGGTVPGAGNVIAFNNLEGIGIEPPSGNGNAFLGNSIYSNGTLGIDLNVRNGVTPNDVGDGDAGANRLQNFPVLTQIIASQTQTGVQGTLNSTAGGTFRIEFFANSSPTRAATAKGRTSSARSRSRTADRATPIRRRATSASRSPRWATSAASTSA